MQQSAPFCSLKFVKGPTTFWVDLFFIRLLFSKYEIMSFLVRFTCFMIVNTRFPKIVQPSVNVFVFWRLLSVFILSRRNLHNRCRSLLAFLCQKLANSYFFAIFQNVSFHIAFSFQSVHWVIKKFVCPVWHHRKKLRKPC